MAKLIHRGRVDVEVTFVVNEAELRALDALVGYGDDAFIKHFYETLGQAYMRDHEAGLRLFFKSIREITPGILRQVSDAHAVFEGRARAATETKS